MAGSNILCTLSLGVLLLDVVLGLSTQDVLEGGEVGEDENFIDVE